MKSDTVFKRAFNDALDLLSDLSEGQTLPSENALSFQLEVSRTTIRKVLAVLAENGTIAGEGPKRMVVASRVASRRPSIHRRAPLAWALRRGGTDLPR